jgi:hypothetical protein
MVVFTDCTVVSCCYWLLSFPDFIRMAWTTDSSLQRVVFKEVLTWLGLEEVEDETDGSKITEISEVSKEPDSFECAK